MYSAALRVCEGPLTLGNQVIPNGSHFGSSSWNIKSCTPGQTVQFWDVNFYRMFARLVDSHGNEKLIRERTKSAFSVFPILWEQDHKRNWCPNSFAPAIQKTKVMFCRVSTEPYPGYLPGFYPYPELLWVLCHLRTPIRTSVGSVAHSKPYPGLL